MALECRAQEGDAVVHVGDVMVFVDEASKPLLAGAQIDFCDGPVAGFIFDNPNLCSGCKTGPGGCLSC